MQRNLTTRLPTAILACRMFRKHYHLASFHQSQEFFEVSFNKKMYNKLAPELQNILRYASEAENSNFYWHNTKRYSEDLAKLRTQGVNVHRTPDSVMEG